MSTHVRQIRKNIDYDNTKMSIENVDLLSIVTNLGISDACI